MINCDIFANPVLSKRGLDVWSKGWIEHALAYDLPYAPKNPQGVHEALAAIHEFVGAPPEDLFFFAASEEEAMNTVFIHVLLDHMFHTGKSQILSLETEGAMTLSLLERLEKGGCSYRLLDVQEDGQLDLTTLAAAITPRVGFVTLSWAHPLTGAVQPVYEIAEICRQHKILLHVRASESLGHLFFRYQDLMVDFLTFSGSCLHLPSGAGGIVAKKGSSLATFLAPVSRTIGVTTLSTNVPALCAMGEQACRIVDQMEMATLEMVRLRNLFEELLSERIPLVQILMKDKKRLPNVTVIAFPYVVSEALAFELAERDIYVSMGGGRFQTLEYVLVKMGCDRITARSALSFAFSSTLTDREVEKLIDVLVELVAKYEQMTKMVL